MPFTVSHAAAVLPLRHTPLPLAALMIGSMSPDFAYFFPGRLSTLPTHTLAGLFLFCWPVGLAVWLFYVRVLERPTIELLPAAWRGRVARSEPRLSPRVFTMTSLAVILGSITHIVWDSFTHAHTFMTDAIPALRTEVFSFHGRQIRLYLVLQVISSVVGLVALALWARNLRHAPARATVASEPGNGVSDRARIGFVAAMLATSVATALLDYARHAHSPLEHRAFHLLIGAMTGWLLAWCAVALLLARRAQLSR